jgi:DNA repair protein RecN (Recombination protein N)
VVNVAGVLSEIRIQGLGVIADATLDPCGGFTVITGETGAGKTMVVAGLGLLLGGKPDSARVRSGSDRALVEGRVRLPEAEDADPDLADLRQQLDLLGAELDADGSLIISRTVHAEGRSRAHAGGRSVPASTLAALGERLVTVHGQSQQLHLLRPAQQRAALDGYAGPEVSGLLDEHRACYQRWRQVAAELADWTARSAQRDAEIVELTRGLAHVDAVNPEAGEDAALREESSRLEHAEELQTAAARAHEALVGDPVGAVEEQPDAAGLLGAARGELHAVAHLDSSLAGYAQRADELTALASDLAADLASYRESVESDPTRLAAVHERRAALTQLIRSYGGGEDADLASVLAWAERARVRLLELESSSTSLDELRSRGEELAGELGELAAKLSAARERASERFGADVTAELAGLAMPHARVAAQVSQREVGDDEQIALLLDGRRLAVGPDGIDEVELLLTPHPGSPALPLHRGASGGELSRIMLAVEVVLASVSSPGTMVFDEVDAGVGGKAAIEVGRRLAKLARNHQVLVVTHLPQVAAFADQHVVVVKDADGSVTTSGLRTLTAGERPSELARMLAGMADSETGIAHAQELLDMARETG